MSRPTFLMLLAFLFSFGVSAAVAQTYAAYRTLNSSLHVTGSNSPTDSENNWDKPLLPTVASGFGSTNPPIAGMGWNGGRFTVGTGPTGIGVIDWPWLQAAAPTGCSAVDETSHTAFAAVPSVSALTIYGSVTAGDVVSFGCNP